jgi:DNA-dependent RNA polymerase auxiliary subunit epsilon
MSIIYRDKNITLYDDRVEVGERVYSLKDMPIIDFDSYHNASSTFKNASEGCADFGKVIAVLSPIGLIDGGETFFLGIFLAALLFGLTAFFEVMQERREKANTKYAIWHAEAYEVIFESNNREYTKSLYDKIQAQIEARRLEEEQESEKEYLRQIEKSKKAKSPDRSIVSRWLDGEDISLDE